MLNLIHVILFVVGLTSSFSIATAQGTEELGVASSTKVDPLCGKKLRKGVTYFGEDAYGNRTRVRLRFAPFELPPDHQKKFAEFRDKENKLYGENHDPRNYQHQVCRYFFGAYAHGAVPEDKEAVKELLKACPLKVLTEVLLAPGPYADCAPSTGQCQPLKRPASEDHPFDHIPCVRSTRD